MISGLIFITFLPIQVLPSGNSLDLISNPLTVSVVIDGVRTLGLPKLKLRDSYGNLYLPNKVFLQEPLAIVYEHSGLTISSYMSAGKDYMSSRVGGK